MQAIVTIMMWCCIYIQECNLFAVCDRTVLLLVMLLIVGNRMNSIGMLCMR